MDAADAVVRRVEEEAWRSELSRAEEEPPWDGYGGLVRICDDEALREHGVVRAVARRRQQQQQQPQQQPSPPALPAAPAALPSALLGATQGTPQHQRTLRSPSGVDPGGCTGGLEALGCQAAQQPPQQSSAGAAAAAAAASAAALAAATAARAAEVAAAAAAAAASVAAGPGLQRVPSWVEEYVLEGEQGDQLAGRRGGGEAPSACGGSSVTTAGSGAAADDEWVRTLPTPPAVIRPGLQPPRRPG